MPHDWFALVGLAFVLGLKHGVDADHLVAIDALARFNAESHLRLARWCGVLFALGHGAVVAAAALAASRAAERCIVPGWLDDAGAWISIAFLTLLGLVNLAVVLGTPVDRVVRPVGVRSRLLGRFARTSHPLGIAGIGALFAVSFDTVTQAALFGVAANQWGGWPYAAALGLAFTLGMTLADGANGFWITALLRHADARAGVASRVLGLTVAGLSLGMAAFALTERKSAWLAAWVAGRELAVSAGVVACIGSAFAVGVVLARRGAPTPPMPPRGLGVGQRI